MESTEILLYLKTAEMRNVRRINLWSRRQPMSDWWQHARLRHSSSHLEPSVVRSVAMSNAQKLQIQQRRQMSTKTDVCTSRCEEVIELWRRVADSAAHLILTDCCHRSFTAYLETWSSVFGIKRRRENLFVMPRP